MLKRSGTLLLVAAAACATACASRIEVASAASDREPEAWSLLETPLHAPVLDAEVRAEREARLSQARAAWERDRHDVDAAIWLGRRTAYLGRYREAIEIFTHALAAHPDEPRLLRHRGHRYITLRRFDLAVADLERATEVIEGRPDEVEPDGLPNPSGVPTSTLHSNVGYHLGLARYLQGDYEAAAVAWRRALDASPNPDNLCAASYWLYLALARAGRPNEAATVLEPIRDDLVLLENHDYHRLLLLFRGALSPAEVESRAGDDFGSVARATVGYGLGAWELLQGRSDAARDRFREVVAGGNWPAFGAIAAEAELARGTRFGSASIRGRLPRSGGRP